ncbi:MAG: anhydro-N-acetylmuramic acid kinase [Betaproteobacteria bacterium]|nr:anhydro-N-acetylmuramic acid kinase [Betaproteobacteria bacterium]
MTARREIFAGVMSGTSLDGVDAVLADFAPDTPAGALLAATHVAFPSDLRRELAALQTPGPDELARAARAANALADLYAHALASVCLAAGVAAHDVVAAGVHGQTVRHRPHEGWTLQVNNPARVAERAYMTVVADFRTRDVAAGGQGAPLVPAFHAARFAQRGRARVVVNIGGIANVTLLPARGDVRGFDTGPGNVLMDVASERHLGAPFDAGGAWAASGRVDAVLLAALLDEPFFAAPPPKSTGRDLFDAGWLDARLARAGWRGRPEDLQATLAQLTARTIADAVRAHAPDTRDVLACGGGARNATLLRALAAELPAVAVGTTEAEGVATDHVEALAFAWLAREALAGRHGNLPAVTGASGPRVLGAIYPR